MNEKFNPHTDDWLMEPGPNTGIVVSSRARLARNLPNHAFAPRAKKEQLAKVAETVREAVAATPELKTFAHYEIKALSAAERRFLKESHQISTELEKGADHREVYINASPNVSVMVNEEDHLRIQTMLAGQRLNEVYVQVDAIEAALEKHLKFAYHPSFGYLTACPTNTGTGLRVSVMLHLIGLVMTNQIEDALSPLGNFGMVVRGSYGEHSRNTGELFQVSNEVTLGKTEEDFIVLLEQLVSQVIAREARTREQLFIQDNKKYEDIVFRSLGTLTHARSISSDEAVGLLSRLRLGIERDYGINLTHGQLNRLMIEVQPSHLASHVPGKPNGEERDIARADFLRARFNSQGKAENN